MAFAAGHTNLRIGFVPLIDAAPLVVAKELGFFHDEGLSVTLDRQVGWANVRDKLTAGALDASHALLGMPLASQLGRDWFREPLVSVMALSSGGNAITVGRTLAGVGVNSAATLARHLKDKHRDSRQLLVFAHVFGCSMHHYLLREWLSSAGLDPDRDVRLCVIPPAQMPLHLHRQHLDGFCVGEPWNTFAARKGYGQIVLPTTDILPAHPEKVLAVSRPWLERHAAVVTPLVRALIRACDYCAGPANFPKLAELLTDERYVDAPADVVMASLTLDRTVGLGTKGAAARAIRPTDWQMRSFASSGTFPSRMHVVWLLDQMIRWGHADVTTDARAVADACVETRFYRAAASSLGIACPDDDYPPMPMRGGQWYRAKHLLNEIELVDATGV
jgi:ABC-type nitrate/sulfonate/bicarbonate transport system substrate-binding protein